MDDAALILCAGSGTRMKGTAEDKVLMRLNDKPVLHYSMEAFAESGEVRTLCLVCRDEAQRKAIEAVTGPFAEKLAIIYAIGGKQRQDSVLKGLQALPKGAAHVFIHDAARPLVGIKNIQAVGASVRQHGAAVLAHPVADTIKQVPPNAEIGMPSFLIDQPRHLLWAMETPQAFELGLILEAYRMVIKEKLTVTDDTAAVTMLGRQVAIVPNENANPKLTRPDDVPALESALKPTP